MDVVESLPKPQQDLQHAQAMLSRMTPEELLTATYALEDILDGAVYVTTLSGGVEDETITEDEQRTAAQGRRDLAEGRICMLSDVLEDLNLTMSDLDAEVDSVPVAANAQVIA